MMKREDLPKEAGVHLWTDDQIKAFDDLMRDSGVTDARVYWDHIFGTVMVEGFHGMTVGIEDDGYTHS